VFAQHQVPKQKNIEIEGPRPILHTSRTVPPEFDFEIEQRLDQLARSQVCFKRYHRIQKPRLIRKPHRLG